MKTLVKSLLLLTSIVKGLKIWEEEFDKYEGLNVRLIFEEWKKDHNKEYLQISDEANHYSTFVDNLKMICNHNGNTNSSYKMRLNQFGDLNGDQFREVIHGKKGSCLSSIDSSNEIIKISPNKPLKNKINDIKVNALPDSVDWTTKGVVTPVKNQGSCGSCWAFSTTGSTECRIAIATGNLVSLSEQQLVDCSTSEGNEGCDGGLMDYAFEYIEKNGGLCSESEYPYQGVDGTCKSTTCGTKYDDISSYTDVTHDDDTALATAVVNGCVSVAIEADQSSFQFYSSGILDGNCGTNLDHGVLVVGYGTGTQNGKSMEYWKVKNSWGTSWGMQGYVLICRNCDKNGVEGECGINMEPSYPNK